MERVTDPGTASEAWKAAILPLNYTRALSGRNNRTRTYISRLSVSTGYKPAALPLSYIPIGGDNENRTRVQTFSLWLYTPVEPFYPQMIGPTLSGKSSRLGVPQLSQAVYHCYTRLGGGPIIPAGPHYFLMVLAR